MQIYEQWKNLFQYPNSIEILSIGAVFNGNSEYYYRSFYPHFYDYLIYMDNTTASHLIAP